MTTDDLLARHRAVLPSWMMLYYADPIELVSGSGRRVTDAQGRTYLDFFGGVLTNSIGYDIPEIREAVERQLRTGIVHTSTIYLIRQQVELAEKIARLSGIPDARVFFTNSGTEANEAALLVATNFRRSHQVLAVRNSYHGRSYAAMGVTGNRNWSVSGLNPLQVAWLHSGDRVRGLLSRLPEADRIDAAVEDLREVLATQTAGDVACLIAEPIQGVGGFVAPPDGLFAAWKKVLDEHGILLVSDEVQTGWGRTGEHFWGYQAHGVTPDLLTFAKGVGNGFALAGVVGRADVLDSVSGISFSTFGGNPLSAAAGNAVLDYLRDHDLQANAARVGAILADGLRAAVAGLDRVAEVRGRGLMLGVEFVRPGTTEPDPVLTTRVFEACRAGGLLAGKGGLHGNVLRMGPPLTLTEDEAREGLAILVEAIRSCVAEAVAA
ncbi:aspartate aminotransferase family protein [Micromonospora endolithica]|uniref:alanine--glyoxylate transaminase n=1 Tax=Micromonospora endolithica TaxID=230091 RepID=A0A3A9ZQQ3_9ACTN|nr:aspartate aminotransferase family protein [Micromonospora endolithica]RKN50580.1 aspartate aminotransferase family protein [Micromonospora endolithica]TWJ20701.1 4-aminobutyrate aminotransferase [Micromonospora endolithica]